jgi:hypothetical protein
MRGQEGARVYTSAPISAHMLPGTQHKPLVSGTHPAVHPGSTRHSPKGP